MDLNFEIKEENIKADYGKFVISPLVQGYGLTLGNSLRRVMLTSLSGIAITMVKISGVKHQFSSLEGMKEDVVEFVLNLKKVRFSGSLKSPAKATISVSGSKVVKAGDIKVSGGVKVANPELEIATLNKGTDLEVELTIEQGVGYSTADERSADTVGVISIDASFSPVKRVSYKVEETRVGRLTNFDKLVLEVWTDGTVSPKDAVVESAKILIGYFEQVVNPKVVEVKDEVVTDTLGAAGKLSVEEISLPTRVANALVKSGYETVEDLVNSKKEDLVKVRNLGEKSLKIIAAALGAKGVTFPHS